MKIMFNPDSYGANLNEFQKIFGLSISFKDENFKTQDLISTGVLLT